MRLSSKAVYRFCVVLLMIPLAGCAGSDWNPTAGLESANETVSSSSRPPALSSGQPVSNEELLPVLAELAGQEALREIALDRELAFELDRRGIEITADDIDAERERLASALGVDEFGDELTRQILAARSIGPQRLGSLLKRNAGLRRLIAPPVAPPEASLQVAFDVRHGPKRRVRFALFATSREASLARARMLQQSEDSGVVAAFAEVASERSIDRTASVGGLLGDLSVSDPGLPAALRREIAQRELLRIGDIVALEQGFALVLVEADIAADGTAFADVETQLASSISERATRLAMEDLAEELIRRAQVTPLSPSLRWSWDRGLRSPSTPNGQ